MTVIFVSFLRCREQTHNNLPQVTEADGRNESAGWGAFGGCSGGRRRRRCSLRQLTEGDSAHGLIDPLSQKEEAEGGAARPN